MRGYVCVYTHAHTHCRVLGCERRGREETPGVPEESRWTESWHIRIRICVQFTPFFFSLFPLFLEVENPVGPKKLAGTGASIVISIHARGGQYTCLHVYSPPVPASRGQFTLIQYTHITLVEEIMYTEDGIHAHPLVGDSIHVGCYHDIIVALTTLASYCSP